jgi:hypothetical protein
MRFFSAGTASLREIFSVTLRETPATLREIVGVR